MHLLKTQETFFGNIKQQDKDSTGLQELSIMNNNYFGTIHYDKHLDMKLDYTISRTFQEKSLTELETQHQLCELERTQIPAIQISINNRSAYTLNPTFNTTYVQNNFKNYSQKWTQYNDNP